ncbi:GNAT family N-acetyltransferase [Lactiplantibacillus fabifermentans]|uniref:Acetyltransferase, GNAT family protein n=2 Tax=Lactiplantibacillus fabifermentans TaxID=483011 RepID=A0A0R2NRD2_9LACO|nr:GNAT family N-acetyltransferase [Lactiplantibacillus fabifermentans]ETY74315.1 GNAT family acetyltransferase [Lactiplantibacillus fabifermentans T30PCM01]KRO26483.1 Acetyltransferase, GNAT family protein [Lactiplantibacillus fabifermentans DSM 21115]
MVLIRRFRKTDATAAVSLIATTLKTSNAVDYSPEYIQATVQRITPAWLMQKAQATHFYVVIADDQLVGTGAIGPFWGSQTESSLFTIFVSPSWQGHGIGNLIMAQLQTDPYYLRAKRIEVPASITGRGFYVHYGYQFKPGVPHPDAEQLYRLEKWRL